MPEASGKHRLQKWLRKWRTRQVANTDRKSTSRSRYKPTVMVEFEEVDSEQKPVSVTAVSVYTAIIVFVSDSV